MHHHKQLKALLKPHLGWHGARLNFLALFLIALIQVKTVNLSEIALGLNGTAQASSNYKRLQRFFRFFEIDYPVIARMVVALMEIPEPWVLSIDRSEWEFGAHRYNILTLGIVHQGVAFPVLWEMLDKQGNSNTDERIQMLEHFGKIFPTAKIAALTGDREFVGQVWLRYLLLSPEIPFVLRIRHSERIERQGQSLKARVMFAHLLPEQSQQLSGPCRVWGYLVSVAALRTNDGELLLVIGSPTQNNLLKGYRLRWGIETLFGILKSRGFCLESTHFKDNQRLSKLLALLTLALCWAMRTGMWLHQLKPLTLKKHGRRAKSLFRYGLDYLRSILFNLDTQADRFSEVLKLLSCT